MEEQILQHHFLEKSSKIEYQLFFFSDSPLVHFYQLGFQCLIILFSFLSLLLLLSDVTKKFMYFIIMKSISVLALITPSQFTLCITQGLLMCPAKKRFMRTKCHPFFSPLPLIGAGREVWQFIFARAKNYAFTLEDRRVQLILILNNCSSIFIILLPDCKELGNASFREGPLKNAQEI